MTEMLLRCCSALERHTGKRESEFESERVGEWRAEGSLFWHGRAGWHRWTTSTWHEWPRHGQP